MVILNIFIEFIVCQLHLDMFGDEYFYVSFNYYKEFLSFCSVVYYFFTVFVFTVLKFSTALVNDVIICITLFLETFKKTKSLKIEYEFGNIISASPLAFLGQN